MHESRPEATTPADEAVWDALPDMPPPVYGIDERPPTRWETVLYGWQHTLVDVSPFVLPLAVAAAIGMSAAEEARFINFGLFSMGLATLIQTTIGNRLPIIQGPSATLTGTLAPVVAQLGPAAMWGAAFVGGLVEMAFGASRALGGLRRLFPPVVAGVVVLTIALALGQVAVRLTVGDGRAVDFLLAALVIALILFILVCGMIAVSGIRLLSVAKPTPGNQVVAGTTLVVALGLPAYARYVLGSEWLESLPAFAGLIVTNPVVLAVLLGVGLHAILNLAAGGGGDAAV